MVYYAESLALPKRLKHFNLIELFGGLGTHTADGPHTFRNAHSIYENITTIITDFK